jgi:hypothetical protein
VVALSDSHLGTLLLYSGLRTLGLDREGAFQAWVLVLFSLNYIACFLVLRRLSLGTLGAAAGAFVFSFSLPVAARMLHVQLLPRFCVPVAFYFAWNYLHTRRVRSLAGLSVALVWQFYCTIYIGIFTIYLLLALLAAHTLLNLRKASWRRLVGGLRDSLVASVAIVLASTVALLPLMLPHFRAAREVGLRSWSTIVLLLPQPQSHFRPFSGSLLWSWLRPMSAGLPYAWEHEIFVGAVPLACLVAVGLLSLQSRLSSLAPLACSSALAFLFLVALTTSAGGASLYRLVALAPGIRAIQAVGRIALVSIFLLALEVGVVITRVEEYVSANLKPLAAVAVLAASACMVALDQYCRDVPSFAKAEAQRRSASLAGKVASANRARGARAFYFMPSTTDPYYVVHLDAMMAGQVLGLPTLNGYSGNAPANYPLGSHFDDASSLARWIEYSTISLQGSAPPREDAHCIEDILRNVLVIE